MIEKSSGLPGYYFNPPLSLAVVFLASAKEREDERKKRRKSREQGTEKRRALESCERWS